MGGEPQTEGEREAEVRRLRAAGFPRPLGPLYAVMGGAILLQLGLHAWTFAAEVLFRGDVTPDLRGGFNGVGHAYRASFFVFAVAIPTGCVAWMRWLDWSVKNRLVRSEGRFGRTPAGVVWGYFVPVANLYRPLFDLRRLYRAETRFNTEPPGVLTVWWVITLAHLLLMLFDLREGIHVLTAASSALGVLSNALALAVIATFARVQERAARGGREAARPDTEPLGAPA